MSRLANYLTESITAYHGTDKNIRKFNIFSHFGTKKAAEDRLTNSTMSKRKGIHIYSVTLTIKKPLRVDDTNAEKANSVAQAARIAGVLTWDDVMRIWDIDNEEEATKEVIRMLGEKGYDGLVYKNDVEDAGNDSYVIFSPKQVTRIKKI